MPPYVPRKTSRSTFVRIRGVDYHLREWGEPDAPLLVMVHGWMDVSASFQFLVDALAKEWHVVAPDWRGYGLTANAAADCYWMPDYLGDLDAILRHVSPDAPVRLVAHSLGGNVACMYAGVRPDRIERLVNLEGLGMPGDDPSKAPERLAKWLGELREPPTLTTYPSRAAVVARLQKTNPRLPDDRAGFLAAHWSRPDDDAAGDRSDDAANDDPANDDPGNDDAANDGPKNDDAVNDGRRYRILGDPAHKVVNPYVYRADEVVACWAGITAPVLWVMARDSDYAKRMDAVPGYADRIARIADVRRLWIDDAGHMLHHDQPERLAVAIEGFLG